MSLPDRARRWSARGAAATMALLAASAAAQAAVPAAQAAVPAAQASRAAAAAAAGSSPVNPYAPAYHHPYRRGAVPTRGAAARMAGWARQHPGAVTSAPVVAPAAATGIEPASATNVRYGGGVDGIGVTTGDERVYLVFFGSQWGTTGTNTHGDITLSGDPSGEAPYLQEMFKGLGTGGEQWSGVMTQYCEGVSPGAQTCPATVPHVAYPHGGALAGVWVDESAASPTQATGDQLAQEAIAAAAHFGNTTAASNRDAQYVILSPAGTHPDGFNTQSGQDFCAWHDWNGDTSLSGGGAVPSPDGDIAFTNMPYVTDAGVNCGANFVRSTSAGKLDGVSIVEGHEYAETITDQNPAGGWVDLGGEETADKCAWIPPQPHTAGSAAVLHLTTGAFAMQTIWANNASSGKGGCRLTQTIKRTELLRNPGFETGKLTPWGATPGVLKKKASSFPVHAGNWLARLGGRTAPHTDTLAQTVTVAPANGTYGAATFSFWLEIKTNDPASKASDTLTVQVLDASGTVVKQTLHVYSNLDAVGHYVQHSFSLNSFLGQTIVLRFTGAQTLSGHSTSFLIDDTALNAS